MTYPALELINRSWNLSGIVARGLQTVNGDQSTLGLFLLNELLDFKSCDTDLIPYWQRAVLQLVQGQELYFIPNLVQIETFTFNIGPIRFPTNEIQRDQYFGSGRVDNIQSLPFSWHQERAEGGTNLYIYFVPNQAYPANITGKYALTDVSLQTDLSTVYDGFYITYLRYALAKKMCLEYDIDFGVEKEKYLLVMEKKLQYIEPPDYSLQKVSFISSNRYSLDWQSINLTTGYWP